MKIEKTGLSGKNKVTASFEDIRASLFTGFSSSLAMLVALYGLEKTPDQALLFLDESKKLIDMAFMILAKNFKEEMEIH